MAERDFFRDDSKRRVTEAIQAIEAGTSVEVVVSVHHRSASHRDLDFLAGFALCLLVLVAMLFTPPEFPEWSFAVAAVLAFGGGAALSSMSAPLHRALAPSRARAAVHAEACAAFVRLGVSRTRRRSGMLVFVSAYERRVDVVCDVGIDRAKLGAPFSAAVAALEAAASRLDLEAFVVALRALGAPLAAAMPAGPDDVNELPDEVFAA